MNLWPAGPVQSTIRLVTVYPLSSGGRQSLLFHVSLTFLVYLPSDLVLLHIPLRIPHLVNYCSRLISGPPPPSHGVTVDTWHLEMTTRSSSVKC